MHYKDPLYPVWLATREVLVDAVPEDLHTRFAYTCGLLAERVVRAAALAGISDEVAREIAAATTADLVRARKRLEVAERAVEAWRDWHSDDRKRIDGSVRRGRAAFEDYDRAKEVLS